MPNHAGPDQVAAHLRTAHTELARPSRWHRTQRRWARTCPALSNLTPDDFHTRFTDRHHPEHTTTCVALLRLQQAGDTDAATLLLTAIAPILGTIARRDHRPDRFDHLWAATARLLATGNPDSYPSERPFLLTFMGRLRRDAQRLRDAESRAKVIPITVMGTGPRCSRMVPAFGPTHASSIDDLVIARAELASVANFARATTSVDRWNELVNHALDADPLPMVARVRIHRLRRQLVEHLAVA
jgi:hypothetical protein